MCNSAASVDQQPSNSSTRNNTALSSLDNHQHVRIQSSLYSETPMMARDEFVSQTINQIRFDTNDTELNKRLKPGFPTQPQNASPNKYGTEAFAKLLHAKT